MTKNRMTKNVKLFLTISTRQTVFSKMRMVTIPLVHKSFYVQQKTVLINLNNLDFLVNNGTDQLELHFRKMKY